MNLLFRFALRLGGLGVSSTLAADIPMNRMGYGKSTYPQNGYLMWTQPTFKGRLRLPFMRVYQFREALNLLGHCQEASSPPRDRRDAVHPPAGRVLVHVRHSAKIGLFPAQRFQCFLKLFWFHNIPFARA